jgi:outer membrane protein assembly factor BamB
MGKPRSDRAVSAASTLLIAVVLGLGAAVTGTRAAEQPLTADQLIQKTGISGGLCAFPRATAADAPLALELARRPAFVVHLLAREAAVAARIRAAADAAGVLGRSLYVEQADQPSPLPFADRLVDLLVVTSQDTTNLSPELKREWLRVLAPKRGAACLRNASGNWMLLRADMPAGSDAWTHRCHGADNVQASSDTTFQAPFLAQWWGLPRQEGFWGTTVVSGNGRMFTVRASRNSGEGVFLTARSLTSGVVLWQKRLRQADENVRTPHGGYVPGRACGAVNGDILCLIDRDAVAFLNGETGAEQGRIVGPKPGGQIKWLGISSNRLAVLAGDADVMQPISYQTVAANPIGRDLAVYDLASNRELWRDTVAGDIDERVPAMRNGRLYYLAQGVGVVARELATGREIWKNDDAAIQENFRTPEQKKIGALLGSQPVTLALDDVLLMRTPWAKEIVALSSRDGARLWQRPSGLTYRGLTAMALNGLWLGDKGLSIDLQTGLPAQGPKFISSGCGPTLSVPGYLITCFGAVAEMKTGKVLRTADLKSPCDVGTLVSEGVMVTVPSECGCAFEMKCYRALASAGEIKPHAAPPWQERLTQLGRKEPAAMALTAADWPTYRHDAQRRGASTAALGEKAKILWQWKPGGATAYTNTWNPANGPRLAPDYLATAPVTGGGKVYFASHDGVIRCLQADSGKELWTFPTGSMLFAPPTLWEGRVLAGGGDGRIYCLDATTGQPLWRLHAAPHDRRIFWMGHLISTWPVLGGVVVQDGVGYAVAGYQAENGIHAYAFEPKTGKVIWEKHDAGAGKGNPAQAMTSGGGVAIAEDRLCLAGWSSGSFDLKTGDWKVSGGAGFGSEIGVLCNRWVLRGGRRLAEPESAIAAPISSGFALGVPGLTSLPAWDADLVIFAPGKASGSLLAVPADKYVAWKTAAAPPLPPAPNKPVAGSSTNRDATAAAALPQPKAPELADFALWTSAPGTPASFALAQNMVVAALADARSGHKLVAFRRTDGTSAWSVDLPDQPAMNRLAIERDGRVLVSLCDGSVICADASTPAAPPPPRRDD